MHCLLVDVPVCVFAHCVCTKPLIDTSIAGVTGIWALHDAAAKGGPELHTNLIVSTADGTRVLEDSKALNGEGDDLAEVSDMCVGPSSLALLLSSVHRKHAIVRIDESLQSSINCS